jgi:hypothetical protein
VVQFAHHLASIYIRYTLADCEAVSTIPHWQPKCFTAKTTWRRSENRILQCRLPKKHLPLLSLRYHYYDDNHAIAAFKGWLGKTFHESDKSLRTFSKRVFINAIVSTPIIRAFHRFQILDFINRSSKSLRSRQYFFIASCRVSNVEWTIHRIQYVLFDFHTIIYV